jgi:hypothetical protein
VFATIDDLHLVSLPGVAQQKRLFHRDGLCCCQTYGLLK